MAWPPSYSAAYSGSGYTYIKWGTDGILAAANGTTGAGLPVIGTGTAAGGVIDTTAIGGSGVNQYIVESIRGNDEIDTYYIKQGSGFKATRIMLVQGRKYVLTVVDDANMIAPKANSKAYIIDIQGGANSLYYFTVIENGYNAAREVEGKREITVEYLNCIEGLGTSLIGV